MLKFLRRQERDKKIDQHTQGDNAHQDVLKRRIHRSSFTLLQALTGYGEVDERYKRHNGHHDDNQIKKHVVPPRQAADFENP